MPHTPWRITTNPHHPRAFPNLPLLPGCCGGATEVPDPPPPLPPHSPQEFLWEKEGSDAPLQLSSDSILIFPFLNKSDSGTYVCTATSSMGSVVAKYNLDVSGKGAGGGHRQPPASPTSAPRHRGAVHGCWERWESSVVPWGGRMPAVFGGVPGCWGRIQPLLCPFLHHTELLDGAGGAESSIPVPCSGEVRCWEHWGSPGPIWSLWNGKKNGSPSGFPASTDPSEPRGALVAPSQDFGRRPHGLPRAAGLPRIPCPQSPSSQGKGQPPSPRHRCPLAASPCPGRALPPCSLSPCPVGRALPLAALSTQPLVSVGVLSSAFGPGLGVFSSFSTSSSCHLPALHQPWISHLSASFMLQPFPYPFSLFFFPSFSLFPSLFPFICFPFPSFLVLGTLNPFPSEMAVGTGAHGSDHPWGQRPLRPSAHPWGAHKCPTACHLSSAGPAWSPCGPITPGYGVSTGSWLLHPPTRPPMSPARSGPPHPAPPPGSVPPFPNSPLFFPQSITGAAAPRHPSPRGHAWESGGGPMCWVTPGTRVPRGPSRGDRGCWQVGHGKVSPP